MVSNRFWGMYALGYDAVARLTPYQEMMGDLIAALELRSGMRILDVGCGTGNLEAAILDTGIAVEIEAVDRSQAMLRRARRKVRCGRVRFRPLDVAQPLPYADEAFDAVVGNNVLYALSAPEAAISEFRRVLKPAGRLVISDPKKDSRFMAIFWAHLSSGGRARAVGRFAALLGSVVLLPELLLVAVVNVLIDRAGRHGDCNFRTSHEWQRILRSPSLSSTYADQNWLAVETRGTANAGV